MTGSRYPDSYYAATAVGIAERPVLRGAERADVCGIGGGYAGLSAALNLAEQGFDVVEPGSEAGRGDRESDHAHHGELPALAGV